MRALVMSGSVCLVACLASATGPAAAGPPAGLSASGTASPPLLTLPPTAATPPPPPPRVRTLPERMASTGGGTQLITAVTRGGTNASRDGTLTWWQRIGSRWVAVGSAGARFGMHGLSGHRLEGDGTTPTGLFTLPMAFGIRPDPGTRLPWRAVDRGSWWDENSRSARYNTWYEHCPVRVCWTSATRRRHSSEHLINFPRPYAYAVVIGFNTGAHRVRPPARPSGSGIFLHVAGSGHTAGCISVNRSALVAILRWLDPAASPHIAIGNTRSIYGL